jgi:hypothetical protein
VSIGSGLVDCGLLGSPDAVLLDWERDSTGWVLVGGGLVSLNWRWRSGRWNLLTRRGCGLDCFFFGVGLSNCKRWLWCDALIAYLM